MDVLTVFLFFAWCAAMTMLGGLLHDALGWLSVALVVALTAVAVTVTRVKAGGWRIVLAPKRGRLLLGLGALLGLAALVGVGAALAGELPAAPLVLTTGAAAASALIGAGFAARPQRPRRMELLYWVVYALTMAGIGVAVGKLGLVITSSLSALIVRLMQRYAPHAFGAPPPK